MTVIRPNSVSGINSITVASGAALAVHKADGTLIQTLSGAAGVSTFTSVSVGSATTSNSAAKSINIGLGASIAQHDVNTLTFGTNGDPRVTIDASGNFNVGSAATIKAGGNATFSGIVTATAFKGDGSGLSGVTAVTINNNADNRIITGSGSANTLNGESNLTFDALAYSAGGAERLNIAHTSGGIVAIKNPSNSSLQLGTNDIARMTITSSGGVGIGTDNPSFEFTVADMTGAAVIRAKDGANNKIVDLIANSTGGLLRTIGAYPLVLNTNQEERLRINSSGNLLIGNTSSRDLGGLSTQKLTIEDTSGNAAIGIINNQNSGGFASLRFAKSRGTSVGSNTVVQSGDPLGGIIFCGADGTDMASIGAQIICDVDGTPGSNDMPGRLEFHTTADGSATSSERLRIHAAGNIACGDTNDLSESSEYALVVHPNRSDATKDALGLYIKGIHGQGGGTTEHSISLRVDNTNTYNNATHMYGVKVTTGQQLLQPGTGVDSNVTGLYSSHKCFNAELNKNLGAVTEGFSYFSNVVPTNSGGAVYHFFGQDNGTTKVYIEQDGDIKNANNSYGSSSDVKLKENIVDAGSQWDDIKGLRIRNFNFKSDPDKVKMLGVVAQEAEPISPGLIDTQNDIETDATTGMGTITGTTKYVKYSILYMKAVKALQEAQTRIETLETKVAALEGG